MAHALMDKPLRDVTASYEFLFRSSADGILIADGEGLLIQMNPAASALLSLTPEDSVGKSVREVFGKNSTLLFLFTSKGEQKQDVRLARKRVAVGIADTLSTGERIVILQDVTEKRSIEDRREMLSKAISHDLSNPISAVGGFADLLSRFGDLNEQQQKYYQRIKQTTTKLHDMVKSLVDLAWIEAGMPLEYVPIRPHELINEVVSDLGELATKKKIGILVSLQAPLPVVMGDPDRLRMAVYSLLHNAIMYSHEESNVAIHAWGDQHELYCSVADRGIGIMESEIEMVFDRMFRSKDERVRAIPGGGLGLTIARTIIRRHGGDLWANSIFDEGSTFMFVLPVVNL